MSAFTLHARVVEDDAVLMRHNPVKGLRKGKIPEAKQKPHLPWTPEAVAKFRAEALPLPRLIFEVGVGTVQRPADWCRFTWGAYDGDTLRIVQGKTGVALTLPCTAALRAALDAVRPVDASADAPILCGARGGRLRYKDVAEIMLKERRRLGVEAHDLHALRYTGVQELALAGCDDDEIASYSGHTSKAMIRKYAGEARQLMRALSAREKRW
ncbi:tyrosine-type recombinase/integrase [Rhodobacter capsulatus]|uniref:tyrosine-type recombinase/integrase n=1 Tax=Rhodobacter capsulatus TaxID=1061 RepID=UPI0040292357